MDKYYKLTEKIFIPELVKYNFVKFGDSSCRIGNQGIFNLSILFAFAELYKSYINSLCVSQKYEIRKLVSTRYDLSQPIFDEKYYKFNPQLDLISQTYIYEPQDFNYLNNDFIPKIPIQEEIEEEKKKQNPPGTLLDLPVVEYIT